MKLLKGIISVLLSVILMVSLGSVSLAAETIFIDTITVHDYVDEFGCVDKDLVRIVVDFTITNASEQISILVSSENITEISAATLPKIIYIDQTVTPDETTYEFVVEKSKIKSATGLDDINGCTLYVKMGAMGASLAASKTFEYHDPISGVVYGDVTGDGEVDIGDAIKILRYDARLESLTPDELVAAEVTGDGVVDIGDAIKILRYDAKLEASLK